MARKLSIEIDLDSSGFTAKIKDAAGGVRTFNTATERTAKSVERMERRMHGLLATTRDLTLVLSQVRTAIYNIRQVMTGWLESVVKANASLERMTFLLANMSDATSRTERFREAGDNLRYLFDTAKSAPFSIDALTDSFVKMKSVGIDPTAGSLNSLADAVAAFGGNDDVLHRASIAIQQMGGKGVISMEELRQQLGEAVPSAVAVMARSLNVTYRELVDAISKGQVEAEGALAAMFEEFDRTFGGSAQSMMETFGGKLSQVKTAFIEFSAAVGGFDAQTGQFEQGGFFATLRSQLDGLLQTMNSPGFKNFAISLGEGLTRALNSFGRLVDWVIKYKDAIIAAGKYFAMYFGARVMVATVNNLITAFGSLTASMATIGSGFANVGRMSVLMVDSMTRASGGALTLGQRLKDVGFAAGSIGKSLLGVIGPIGFFVAAAFTAAEALGFFKNKTKEADEALQQFQRNLFSYDGLKQLKDGLDATNNSIEQTRYGITRSIQEIERLQQKLKDDPANSGITRQQIAQLETRLAGQREEMASLLDHKKDLIDQIERGTDAALADRSARDLQYFENAAKERMDSIRSEYIRVASGLSEALEAIKNDEVSSEEAKAASLKRQQDLVISNRREFFDERIKLYEGFLAEIAGIENRLKSGEDLGNFANTFLGDIDSAEEGLQRTKKASEGLLQIIDNLRAEAASSVSITDLVSGAGDGAEKKLTDAEKRIASLESRLGGLNGRLEETGSEVGKILAEKNVKWEIGINISQEEYDRMLELAGKIDETKEKIADKQSDKTLFSRLEGELQRATNAAADWGAVLTGDMSEAEAEMSRFNSRIDQMVEGLKEGKDAGRKTGEEIKDAFAAERGLQFAVGLRQATREMENSLLKGRELKEAEYRRDIERIDEYIDLERYAGEERKRIEAAVNAYKSTRFRQFMEESKTGFRRMMDEWLRTTDAMDSAAQGWMSDFVDSLVEGELKFSEFAEAILKDIAKIIIRAQIAAAAVALINAFTGGGSNNAAGSTAGSGATAIHVGSNHTGGIIGEKSGPGRDVHPAVFAYAKRYHSGGYPGLGPNEVPAILEKGEKVQTVAEQRMAARGGGNNVQVNIFNQSGQSVQEESREGRFDGEQFVLDIVIGAAGRPGGMRTAIQEAANG